MAGKSQSIADMIRYEGVDCKGFGIITKLVMTDTDITIGSKALYSYLCSYAGSDNAAFPKRDKILHDLNMCKTAYYKHLQLLLDTGYIRIERGNTYPFRNTYIIVSRPPKLAEIQLDVKGKDLVVRGIKSLGYGTIPKAVMIDDRLNYKAKALYAYFCSFSGNGTFAFPKRNDILYHLQISINTFQTYIHQLIEYNYITVEQTHEKGRFGKNIYYINDLPDEELGKLEMEKRAEIQRKKTGLVNLPTSDETRLDEENYDDFSYEENEESLDEPVSVKKEKSVEEIIAERNMYEEHIKYSIAYDELKDDDEFSDYADLIVEIMLNAILSKEKVLRINKSDVPQSKVKEQFLKANGFHIAFVIEHFKKANTVPRNINAYLLTAIYNAVNNMEALEDKEVEARLNNYYNS